MLCEFQTHVSICLGDSKDSSKYSKRVIAPDNIVGRLKTIAKHMRLGRQEDAHEFTRYFIDALVKPGLVGYER